MPSSTPSPRSAPLNDSERQWLDAQLEAARSFARSAASPAPAPADSSASASALPSLAILDAAWAAALAHWEAAAPAARPDPNTLINAVGAALGQHIVDGLGFAWVIATDERGADLAVHDVALGAFIYPANMVAKRFAARTPTFLVHVFDQLATDIRRAREAHH